MRPRPPHRTSLKPANLRVLGTFAVVVALVGATGCGGDDEATPSEAAQSAADQFVSSLEAGDFEAACGDMTDALAQQLGGEKCPDQISTIAGQAGEDLSITITDLRVSGPKAVADTDVERAGAPKQESSFDLELSDGTWRVSGLGD